MKQSKKGPSLRDADFSEFIARLGVQHGLEAAAGVVATADESIRAEIEKAASALVAGIAALYERSFRDALQAGRRAGPGGRVKVTVKLMEKNVTFEERIRGGG